MFRRLENGKVWGILIDWDNVAQVKRDPDGKIVSDGLRQCVTVSILSILLFGKRSYTNILN